MSSAEFYQCARSTIDYFDRVLSKATKMVITEPTPPRPDRRRISGASSRRTSSAGMKAPLASIENVSGKHGLLEGKIGVALTDGDS
jgi:hypothetical protein